MLSQIQAEFTTSASPKCGTFKKQGQLACSGDCGKDGMSWSSQAGESCFPRPSKVAVVDRALGPSWVHQLLCG